MDDFWGIVVEQSLNDPHVIDDMNIIAKKQVAAWRIVLVSVAERDLSTRIANLQDNMIDAKDDCWYAHFFRGEELIVVYQDRLFCTTDDPNAYAQSIQHGVNHDIPIEQLDFEPRTKADAMAYFRLVDF